MFGGKCSKCEFTLKYATILASLIFCLGFVYVIMMSVSMLPETFNIVGLVKSNSYEVISSFAKGIFINYVWAFELVSLLLTVVIAGLTMYRKKGV
jgi:NADH:ubiquinone oxidoreductase subunit 6 (subunit J)